MKDCWNIDAHAALEYGYDPVDALLLECNDDMNKRGLASPNESDALALTFGYPVIKCEWAEERRIDEKLRQTKRRFL